MGKIDVRAHLISAGVRNLKEFGYPDVTTENILTDMIYASFFRRMLEDNLGHGFDKEIKSLMQETDGAVP